MTSTAETNVTIHYELRLAALLRERTTNSGETTATSKHSCKHNQNTIFRSLGT